MGKIKLTKNELKRQKDNLEMFMRYLPTLVLKKKQLQQEIIKILHNLESLEAETEILKKAIHKWVSVFSEDIGIEELIKIEKIHTSVGNIAGIDMPVFENVDFKKKGYDFVRMPLWVDYGIEALEEMLTLKIMQKILEKQLKLIREELRITTQRVNLFEKIMIPQTRENIRRISIFLGDLETASVVTGKIAKRKIEEKSKAGINI